MAIIWKLHTHSKVHYECAKHKRNAAGLAGRAHRAHRTNVYIHIYIYISTLKMYEMSEWELEATRRERENDMGTRGEEKVFIFHFVAKSKHQTICVDVLVFWKKMAKEWTGRCLTHTPKEWNDENIFNAPDLYYTILAKFHLRTLFANDMYWNEQWNQLELAPLVVFRLNPY